VLLVAMYGATIGKTGITKIESTTNQACCVLIPLKDKLIDPYFLQQYFIFRRPLIVSLGEGSGQPNISQDFIEKFFIPLPIFDEQQKISLILSNIDSQIKQSQKIIEHSQKFKQGLMQKLLTKGIGHTKFKEVIYRFKRVEKIPSSWNIQEIGKISEKLVSGGTPDTSNSRYWNGTIPWVRSAWFTGHYVKTGERKITQEGLDNSSSSLVKKHHILLASRVSLGNISINTIDLAINQDVTALVLDKSMISEEYLYWILLKDMYRITSIAQGTTIKGFIRDDLSKLKLPIPPLDEQQKIASILSNVDDKIAKKKIIHSKLVQLKRGQMQKLLTGKIRV